MKKKMLQLLLVASGSLLLIAATPQAQAQETAGANSNAAIRRKLLGEIRWKKTIGLPPDSDPNKPLENICQPFYVVVLDPDQNDKVIWFANLLQRGRDKEEFYVCKYEVISVPTNKRLKVVVGMGDPLAQPYGNNKPHWYGDRWVPEGGRKPGDEDRQTSLPIPAGFQIQLGFAPKEKFVMLSTTKDTWLSFELVYGLGRTRVF